MLLAGTNNALGSEQVRQFARDAKRLVVIQDEAGQGPEADAWLFFKLKEFAKIVGLYLMGDQQQLPPPVFSTTIRPARNEFDNQHATSLLTRLIKSGFPFVRLLHNYRAHPDLVAWTNSFVYNGAMVNARGTDRLVIDSAWKNSTKKFLGVQDPNFKANVFLIDVEDGVCLTEPITKTRWNVASAQVGVGFFKAIYLDGALSKLHAIVMVPYKAQQSIWIDLFMARQRARRPIQYLATSSPDPIYAGTSGIRLNVE
ncbi:MAG: hypothetical protein LQ346_001653 [Caloplaca aetnensis]|nr:MAG: hypothetical protein LQ346_001653 [Caloplaca aetnensis]